MTSASRERGSFFSAEVRTKRREAVESLRSDLEILEQAKVRLGSAVTARAEAIYIAMGQVKELTIVEDVDALGIKYEQLEVYEVEQALRNIEAYLASQFARADSEVTVDAKLDTRKEYTGGWANVDMPNSNDVQIVFAHLKFEPPLR
jgi:hypothetical protein